ncbi:hypothetical protein NIES22_72660 (plasmid) [Calothrix brevissima NIES-22]|nr:hypothetical protein NIES22_72660 [Calothrix brevissima NIES-22]
MDTITDFLFLNENLATNFNPFYEDEYLVIQTYPPEKRLIIDKRSFNHKEARNYCDIQNLAHDYTSYSLRIFHNQKLWEVNFMGEPLEVSQQQDWKIHEDYFQAERDENFDCEIVLCRCSYPYFSSLRTFSNNYGEGDEYWQPVTCLVEDNGRDIDNCPNCNCALIKLDENEDEEDDDNYRLLTIVGSWLLVHTLFALQYAYSILWRWPCTESFIYWLRGRAHCTYYALNNSLLSLVLPRYRTYSSNRARYWCSLRCISNQSYFTSSSFDHTLRFDNLRSCIVAYRNNTIY